MSAVKYSCTVCSCRQIGFRPSLPFNEARTEHYRYAKGVPLFLEEVRNHDDRLASPTHQSACDYTKLRRNLADSPKSVGLIGHRKVSDELTLSCEGAFILTYITLLDNRILERLSIN